MFSILLIKAAIYNKRPATACLNPSPQTESAVDSKKNGIRFKVRGSDSDSDSEFKEPHGFPQALNLLPPKPLNP
jgi:hypothetical protein